MKKIILLCILSSFVAEVCFAEIYAYRDSKGRIHITNVPVANIKTTQLQPGEALEKKSNMKDSKESDYTKYIYQYSKTYKVDPNMVRAIIKVESNYNRWAISHKGARGLMQLMPQTAKDMGVKNIFHPAENIEGGVKYFKMLLDKFNNNVYLALAGYNAGPEAVIKYNGIPRYRETQKYVRDVISYYKLYKSESADLSKSGKVTTYKDSNGRIHLTNIATHITED
ncbi:MAG: transglycosylase SLT domain-containing protein [Candidatus Hydrogenedentota bacterium]